jgi:hypothetical protein
MSNRPDRGHRGKAYRRRERYNPNFWAMVAVSAVLLIVTMIVLKFRKDHAMTPSVDLQRRQTVGADERDASPVQR